MDSYRFYCDASELRGPWRPEIEDIVVISGFMIHEIQIPQLLSEIRVSKKELLGSECVPIKWNCKDLKDLQQFGVTKELILSQSDEVRSKILSKFVEFQPVCFTSAIIANSNRKDAIDKPTLTSYCFHNMLQRIGLWAQKNNSLNVTIILDWPDRGKREPFEGIYRSCWLKNGRLVQKNHCGPLINLNFEPGLFFGITKFDPLLQISDLVVGASKSFLKYAYADSNRKIDFSITQFKNLIPYFYRSSHGLVGNGIVISPSDGFFEGKIRAALKTIED